MERVLAAFQIAANVYVLGLSVVGWLWLGAQGAAAGSTGPSAAAGRVPGGAPEVIASGSGGLAGHRLLQPLTGASGATLALIMLATCLLMAPVVNPFYAPPPERRLLHTSTTLLFGVLAVTTVAVITGAAR